MQHIIRYINLKNFSDLGLSPEILKALESEGIITPTEIQDKAIPILLNTDTDFLGLAQTGTGKTAAYGLPLIEKVKPFAKEVQALVVTPTRELGQQIANQLKLFSKFKKGIFTEVVYGGKPIDKQIQYLKRKPQIVIATPGRLIDLMNRRAIQLNTISMVVLDEADEMLNMGFKDDVLKILSHTSAAKKTWLFSATMPPDIKLIAEEYMNDYREVKVNTQDKVNTNITHEFIQLKASEKLDAIERIHEKEPNLQAVVFCKTRRETKDVAQALRRMGIEADAINGDLSQSQRDKVMNKFKAHKLQLLVATDVAARGIDVKDLSHVIHHSLPQELEYYTHRSGRTARAGKKGTSISLITQSEMGRMRWFAKELKVQFDNSELQETFGSVVDSPARDSRNEGRNKRRKGGRSSSYGGYERNNNRSSSFSEGGNRGRTNRKFKSKSQSDSNRSSAPKKRSTSTSASASNESYADKYNRLIFGA